MTRRLASALLIACACACPSKGGGTSTAGSGGTSTAGGGGTGAVGPGCEGVRAKVEELYRAEAKAKEPGRVDEAVADNTAMVLGDCARAPERISACLRAAGSIKLVEACLPPLDPEGSEGDALAR